MLDSISSFFEQYFRPGQDESPEDHEHTLRLATAALLLECAHTDSHMDERETAQLTEILRQRYDLSETELDTLLDLARQEAREATSLYQFTRLFNDAWNYEQKVELLSHLWEIAYADDELDRHEEHMIRRIADLLYVSHSDYIKSKLAVRDRAQ